VVVGGSACNAVMIFKKKHNHILFIPTFHCEIVLDYHFLQDQVVGREEDYPENTGLQMKINYNMSGSPGHDDHMIILGGHRVPDLKLVSLCPLKSRLENVILRLYL
jgi:hypothetical protein